MRNEEYEVKEEEISNKTKQDQFPLLVISSYCPLALYSSKLTV